MTNLTLKFDYLTKKKLSFHLSNVVWQNVNLILEKELPLFVVKLNFDASIGFQTIEQIELLVE
jgi:hypothetical protein